MHFNQPIIFLLILLTALPTSANIEVKLEAPKWEFLLQNEPWAASEAQLVAGERSFARKIQPLLANNNHQAVIKAFEARNLDDDSAALCLLRGQVLLSLKRYSQAEQALLAALQDIPNLALAHRSLSMLYLSNKQYPKARKHLIRSIELGVADAQVYGQLAYVNLQLEQAASAVAGYQYALFMESDNKQWQQGLLYALIQSQAFDQAQGLLDELLQIEPSNTELWLQRGQIAFKQGRSQQAIASLEAALELGVKDSENIAFTAQLHIQNGSPRRAVELLSQHSRELIKAGKYKALEQIAAWLAFQQNWPQLDKLIFSMAQNTSELPTQHQARIAVYQAQIQLAQYQSAYPQKKSAREYLQVAIQHDPSNGEALMTLADLLRDENHVDQAIIYYTRAQVIPTYKERALLGRSQVAIDSQRFTEALRLLRQVIQHNPMRTDVLANIKTLENIVRSEG